jgi:hypothetical protein
MKLSGTRNKAAFHVFFWYNFLTKYYNFYVSYIMNNIGFIEFINSAVTKWEKVAYQQSLISLHTIWLNIGIWIVKYILLQFWLVVKKSYGAIFWNSTGYTLDNDIFYQLSWTISARTIIMNPDLCLKKYILFKIIFRKINGKLFVYSELRFY